MLKVSLLTTKAVSDLINYVENAIRFELKAENSMLNFPQKTPKLKMNSHQLFVSEHRLLSPLQALLSPVFGSPDLFLCLSVAADLFHQHNHRSHCTGNTSEQSRPLTVHLHSLEKILDVQQGLHLCPVTATPVLNGTGRP